MNRFVYPQNIWDVLPKSIKFDMSSVVVQFQNGSFYVLFKENGLSEQFSSPMNSEFQSLEFENSKFSNFKEAENSRFPNLQVYQSDDYPDFENQYLDLNESEGKILKKLSNPDL